MVIRGNISLILLIGLALLVFFSNDDSQKKEKLSSWSQEEIKVLDDYLESQDGDDTALQKEILVQAKKIDAYFERVKAPLRGHGITFAVAAHRYGLNDWPFLLPAIAQTESSGGKHAYNNNPFGWGKVSFENFDHAIHVVAWNLGGHNSNTARYYRTSDIGRKLYHYNSENPKYKKTVFAFMREISKTKI